MGYGSNGRRPGSLWSRLEPADRDALAAAAPPGDWILLSELERTTGEAMTINMPDHLTITREHSAGRAGPCTDGWDVLVPGLARAGGLESPAGLELACQLARAIVMAVTLAAE